VIDTQRLAGEAVCSALAGRNLTRVLQDIWARHAQLTAQQRGAIQDISYGTLRFYGLQAALLQKLLTKPLKDDKLRCLLLVALYQLQHSTAAPYAVVDNAVKTAIALKKPQAKGLVNAVLRNFLRQRETLLQEIALDETARYSHPKWWIDKLKQQYPADWQSVLEANNQHPPMTLRVNRRWGKAEDFLKLLDDNGIEAAITGEQAIQLSKPQAVDKLPHFSEGAVSVQDLGAQFAAQLLDVADGMRVLDACAAPGGKTAHLLETANLDLMAVDSDAARLSKVGENLARLGLKATLKAGDAGKPETWWEGVPFDRILADVPCSASGVVRRHPDIKWLRRASDIAQFAAQQAEILDALWRCLARGGKLLYVTCSVFAEENERQITAFLSQHEDAKRLPLPGFSVPDGQLLPTAQHDGFYYALLSKR
jgi:16S rRNA (cytosine967-C5)-methyltransferase